MDFFRHLLIPHHTNNYRAKILHQSSLFILVFSFFALALGTHFLKVQHPDVLGISYTITEQELLQDTNIARAASSLPPLTLNAELSDAARRKAANMLEKNYWAHFAPDGTTPWSFIKAAGYDYSFAGENLAKGFTNSQDIVNAWMNSPSHKENIMATKYTDIGFAIVPGTLEGEETVLVVQMFGATVGSATVPTTAPPEVQKIAEAEVPVITTVPMPVSKAVVSGNKTKASATPLVNSKIASKSITVGFLVFIIGILFLDLLIVEKKKIPRLVGHNLDHIILLVLFLIFILLEKTGGIL